MTATTLPSHQPVLPAPGPGPAPTGVPAPSLFDRLVRRLTYPAQAPFVSLAMYYAGMFGLWALLLWLFPMIGPAFTGERLAALASDGSSFTDLTRGVESSAGGTWHFTLLLGVAMLGAFQLMIPSSWVYMATRRKKGFDQNIVQTMIVLALAVAGVVVIVRNSLALAFSLAGIVGAVRFRNSLPDTRDTLYIFLSIGVGLAAGVEALGAAAVLSMVFNFIVLAMWRSDYGQCELGCSAGHLLHLPAWTRARPSPAPAVPTTALPPAEPGREKKAKANGKKPYNAVLVVRSRGVLAEPGRGIVEPFLARETKRWELVDVEQNSQAEESVLRYRLRLGKKAEPTAIEDALLSVGGKTLLGARVH